VTIKRLRMNQKLTQAALAAKSLYFESTWRRSAGDEHAHDRHIENITTTLSVKRGRPLDTNEMSREEMKFALLTTMPELALRSLPTERAIIEVSSTLDTPIDAPAEEPCDVVTNAIRRNAFDVAGQTIRTCVLPRGDI